MSRGGLRKTLCRKLRTDFRSLNVKQKLIFVLEGGWVMMHQIYPNPPTLVYLDLRRPGLSDSYF